MHACASLRASLIHYWATPDVLKAVTVPVSGTRPIPSAEPHCARIQFPLKLLPNAPELQNLLLALDFDSTTADFTNTVCTANLRWNWGAWNAFGYLSWPDGGALRALRRYGAAIINISWEWELRVLLLLTIKNQDSNVFTLADLWWSNMVIYAAEIFWGKVLDFLVSEE